MRRAVVLLSLLLALNACAKPVGMYSDPIYWPRPVEFPPFPTASAPPTPPPPPAYMATFSGDFDVVGTEPFWAMEIRRTGLKLMRPDKPDVTAKTYSVTFWPTYAVWAENPINLTLSLEKCSDGMSDRTYAYKAVAIVDGSTLSGCADRPK